MICQLAKARAGECLEAKEIIVRVQARRFAARKCQMSGSDGVRLLPIVYTPVR